MKIEFSGAADRDLEAIRRYTIETAPQYAIDLLNSIVDRCISISAGPLRYPLVPQRADDGLRRRRSAPYLIFFRAGPDKIEIVRVLHEKRDYMRLLDFDEGDDLES